MMDTLGLSFDKSLESVRKKRQICNPNVGFMQQLSDYEQHCAKKRMGGEVGGGVQQIDYIKGRPWSLDPESRTLILDPKPYTRRRRGGGVHVPP